MEQDSNPSTLCKNGCGFYGNQGYEGMCSKCYKDFVKRQQQSSSSGRASPSSCTSASSLVSAAAAVSAAAVASGGTPTLAAASASSLVASLSQTAAAIPTPSPTQSVAMVTPPIDIVGASSSLPALLPGGSQPELPCTPTKSDTAVMCGGEAASPDTPCGSSPLEDDSPGKSKKRNRCYSCRKKVGLTGFECRCGGLFCGLHRYSDKHNCTYDYKADGRAEITKNNPLVVGEKVKKI